jgi:chromosome segregation ATPase
MAKSKAPITREELLAQIEALDASTETGKLKAEVERLNAEVSRLKAENTQLSNDLRDRDGRLATIREALAGTDRKVRTYGPQGSHGEATAAGQRAARMGYAGVLKGIEDGQRDPATGLQWTPETKPVRDLSAGTPKVTGAELERFFPALSGPVVEVSDVEAEAMTAADIALGAGLSA